MSTYDPLYHGSIASLAVPQVGARLHKETAFSLDKLTILFRVRTALIYSVIPPAFSQPPTWFPAPGLYFTDFDTISEEGLVSELVLNYQGCLFGNVPPVYWKDGFTLQAVSTSTDKVSLNLQYRSPGTTYKWYETSLPPDSPRYAGLLSGASAFDNIQTWQIKNNDGSGGVAYADYVEAKNTLSESTQVTQYDKEMIVPDKLWACISTTSSMLLPA